MTCTAFNYIIDDLADIGFHSENHNDDSNDNNNQHQNGNGNHDMSDSDESSKSSNEIILSNANILLQIDNILLYSDLTDTHQTMFISCTCMSATHTNDAAVLSTLTETEQKQPFERGARTDEERWWNSDNHHQNYGYDDKRTNRFSNDIEDVTISSIERM